ncbi:MAG: DUF202 domain-containing protein [Pirellulaceae bacterium]|nr:DUF202 domain-containing protein [Pirellulaceae bacterium]
MLQAEIDPNPASVRDRLAYDRTELANERTLLAYLRTAIALVASGLALWKFFPENFEMRAFGIVSLAVGIFAAAFGVWRFSVVKKKLHKVPSNLKRD